MADIIDGISKMIGGGNNGKGTPQSDPSLAEINKTLTSSQKTLDGLTPKIKSEIPELLKELTKTQKETLQALSRITDHFAPIDEYIEKQYKNNDGIPNPKDNLMYKITGKDWKELGDVKKLPDAFAGGSILIFNKLGKMELKEGIFGRMNSNLEAIKNALAISNKSEGKKEGGGGGSDKGGGGSALSGLSQFSKEGQKIFTDLQLTANIISLINADSANEVLNKMASTKKDEEGFITQTIKLSSRLEQSKSISELKNKGNIITEGIISIAKSILVLTMMSPIIGISVKALGKLADDKEGFVGLLVKFSETINKNKKGIDSFKTTGISLYEGIGKFALGLALIGLVSALIIPAIVGMLALTMFMKITSGLGMSLVKKDTRIAIDSFKTTGISLYEGIGKFALGLALIGLVSVLIIPAIVGMLALTIFMKITSGLGKLLTKKDTEKGIKGIGTTSLLLAAGLLVFGLTMTVLAVIISKFFAGGINSIAIAGVALIALAFFGFILLGNFVKKGGGGIKEFAKGSMLLAVALLVFAGTMIIMGFVVDWMLKHLDLTIKGLIGIIGIFAMMLVIGILSKFASSGLKQFAIGSMLMAVGIIVFSVALLIMIGVTKILLQNIGWLLGGLVGMVGIFLLFGFVIGPSVVPALIGIALFTAASVLLMVGMLAFSMALGAMKIAMSVKISEDQMKELTGKMSEIFSGISKVKISPITLIKLAGFTAASVLLMTGMLAFSLALKEIKSANSIKITQDEIKQFTDKTSTLYDGISKTKISPMTLLKLTGIAAASALLTTVIKGTLESYKALDELEKIQKEFTPEEAQKILNASTEGLIDMVQKSAEVSKGMSKRASEAFATTLGAITNSVVSIVNVIKEVKGMDATQAEEAAQNLNIIMQRFFGFDETGKESKPASGILAVVGGLKNQEKNIKNIGKSLEPFSKAIDSIVQTIDKLKDQKEGADSVAKILGIMMEPILDISAPVQNVRDLATNIKNLNSELGKMTRENKDVLKSLGNIKGSGGFHISLPTKKGNDESGNNAGGGGTSDPITSLAEDVAKIREKLTGSTSSWTSMKA